MCTPKFLRTGTPITDLSYYSLKLNNNIPTTFTTTQYSGSTGYGSPVSINGNISPLPKLNSVIPLPPVSLPAIQSVDNQYHQRPTKLDLLIQTATYAESHSINSLPPSPPRSERASFSSVESETIKKRSHDNDSLDISSNKKLKKSPKLDIMNLVSSSDEEVITETSSVRTPIHVYVTAAPVKTTTTRKNKSAKTQPKSIKLASPSTSARRQRSGPSCDCCRSRKIKCDSEITIISSLPNMYINLTSDESEQQVKTRQPVSSIAHCDYISKDNDFQYFKIIKEDASSDSNTTSNNNTTPNTAINNKHFNLYATRLTMSSFDYLKFKSCTGCNSKGLQCCFSKGFTRNDIIKFNKSERRNCKTSPSPPPQSTTLLAATDSTLVAPPSSSASPIVSNSPSQDVYQQLVDVISPSSALKTTSVVTAVGPLSASPASTSAPAPAPATLSPTTTTTTISKQPSISSRKSSTSKHSKKTSCKSCRYKKIKCLKVEDGSGVCLSCSKKGIDCLFE